MKLTFALIVVGLVSGFVLATAVDAAFPADPKPAATTVTRPVPACVVAQAKTATAWRRIALLESRVAVLAATGHGPRAAVVAARVNGLPRPEKVNCP